MPIIAQHIPYLGETPLGVGAPPDPDPDGLDFSALTALPTGRQSAVTTAANAAAAIHSTTAQAVVNLLATCFFWADWRSSFADTNAVTPAVQGDPVAALRDYKSGLIFPESNAVKRPTLGLSSLSFSGNNRLAALALSENFAGLTAIISGQISTGSIANGGVLCGADTGNDFAAGGFLGWNSGFNGGAPSGADSSYNGVFSGTQNLINPLNIICIYSYNTNIGVRVNGSLLGAASHPASPIAITRIGIGTRVLASNTLSNEFTGFIKQVVVFKSPLTLQNTQIIETFLDEYDSLGIL